MYKHFFKRLIDILVSGVSLIVLAVPLGVVTVWLHFANRGAGAFFRQERPGRNGRIFRILKFKTMTDERDADGKLLPDADRITRVGRFVRSTSIDELPQLWNVFKGDMSLIGPRPLTPDYEFVYDDFQRQRDNVRPGITGLAQVNGRGFCKLSKKFAYDVEYVNNISFLLDCKIILLTVYNVVRRKDIGQGDEVWEQIDDIGMNEKMEEYYKSHKS